MASYRCPVCDRLVTIVSRGYLPGEPRRQDWRLVEHSLKTDPTDPGRIVVEVRCEGSGVGV